MPHCNSICFFRRFRRTIDKFLLDKSILLLPFATQIGYSFRLSDLHFQSFVCMPQAHCGLGLSPFACCLRCFVLFGNVCSLIDVFWLFFLASTLFFWRLLCANFQVRQWGRSTFAFVCLFAVVSRFSVWLLHFCLLFRLSFFIFRHSRGISPACRCCAATKCLSNSCAKAQIVV